MRTHPMSRVGYGYKSGKYDQKYRPSGDTSHSQAAKTHTKGKGKGKGKHSKDDKKAKVSWPERKGNAKGAATLRNGEPICAAWNEGRCPNGDDACPNGKHVCNAVLGKSKRVCGMRNHKRTECKNVKS